MSSQAGQYTNADAFASKVSNEAASASVRRATSESCSFVKVVEVLRKRVGGESCNVSLLRVEQLALGGV